jgi:hypothetical protein
VCVVASLHLSLSLSLIKGFPFCGEIITRLPAVTEDMFQKFLLQKAVLNVKPRSIQQSVRLFSLDPTSSAALRTSNLEYCVDLVKKHDLENYLIGTLHVPREFRASFFSIHSFNIEVALIRSQGK